MKLPEQFKLGVLKACILCQTASTDDHLQDLICRFCFQDLPRNLLSCQRCAIPLNNTTQTSLTCGACQNQSPSFDKAISTFRYEYPINKLINAFKYQRRIDLIPTLARHMSQDIQSFYEPATHKPDGVIPVPLHRLREFARGYNQAELLAKSVSKELGLVLLNNVLQRTKITAAQSSLDKKKRKKNLSDAFALSKSAITNLHYVVLIDDVMTTGATLESASRVLKKAGVERIDVWCLARADISS